MRGRALRAAGAARCPRGVARADRAVAARDAADAEVRRPGHARVREAAVAAAAVAAAAVGAAAEPVLRWLDETGAESVVLRQLAAQLKGKS